MEKDSPAAEDHEEASPEKKLNRRARRALRSGFRRGVRRSRRRLMRQLRQARLDDGARTFDVETEEDTIASLVHHGLLTPDEAEALERGEA